jgi:enhancing lycopene biosynthesis protein 2
MKRVGVLLSGCGRHDGSEVQEAVLLILALRRRGLRPIFLAPDGPQRDVVDHTTGNAVEDSPSRDVLHEAARLVRGPVRTPDEVAASELDALVIPGGSGAVKNLCLPGKGPLGVGPVRDDVGRILDGLRQRGAPVAVVGLAEVVLARHEDRPLDGGPMAVPPTEIVADDERMTLFTPGFMGTDDITEAARGLDRLVDEIARRLGMTPDNGGVS